MFIPTVGRLVVMILISLATAVCGCRQDVSNDNACRRARLVEESKIQYREGNYNAALSTLHGFLQLEADATDPYIDDDMINAYIMLGNIHLAFGDYVRAQSYYEEGLKASRKAGMTDNEVKFLNDLAIVNCYLGNREKAEGFNRMMAGLKPKDSLLQNYFYRITSAYIENAFGSREKAIMSIRETLAFIDSVGLDERLKLSSLSELSEYFEKTDQLDSALYYLDIYDTIAHKEKAAEMIADNKRRYMRVYTKLGDMENALKYQEEYFTHTDSAMNALRFINASNRFQQHKEARTGIMIEDLKKTISNQKMTIAIIVFSICIVILWLSFRHKERIAYRQLFRRNRELVEIEEKVRLIESRHSMTDAALSDEDGRDFGAESGSQAVSLSDDRNRLLFERISSYMSVTDVYCDPEFSLSRLAKAVESNTKYVSMAINDNTGKNFRTFINEYRIREARRRLLDSDNYGNVTIQYLAESVGFMSTSAFNMAFRKFTGMTPTLYQKMGRNS